MINEYIVKTKLEQKKWRIWLQKRFQQVVIQYDNNNIEEGENTIVDIAIGTSYMARINQ